MMACRNFSIFPSFCKIPRRAESYFPSIFSPVAIAAFRALRKQTRYTAKHRRSHAKIQESKIPIFKLDIFKLDLLNIFIQYLGHRPIIQRNNIEIYDRQ